MAACRMDETIGSFGAHRDLPSLVQTATALRSDLRATQAAEQRGQDDAWFPDPGQSPARKPLQRLKVAAARSRFQRAVPTTGVFTPARQSDKGLPRKGASPAPFPVQASAAQI